MAVANPYRVAVAGANPYRVAVANPYRVAVANPYRVAGANPYRRGPLGGPGRTLPRWPVGQATGPPSQLAPPLGERRPY